MYATVLVHCELSAIVSRKCVFHCLYKTVLLSYHVTFMIYSHFQAYKVGLYGPKIVWLFMGYYSRNFWTYNLGHEDCSEEEMTLSVEGVFLVKPNSIDRTSEERGIAGLHCTLFKCVARV